MYDENLKTNELIIRHDLVGYIDRKLSNLEQPGELLIDLSKTFESRAETANMLTT